MMMLVYCKLIGCAYCHRLSKIWHSIIEEIGEVYPDMKFIVVEFSNSNENSIIPKNLIKYVKWFPTILLVPDFIWHSQVWCN